MFNEKWSEKMIKHYSTVLHISPEDVIAYFSEQMLNFGLCRQFSHIRIDSGKEKLVPIEPVNLNDCDFKYNRVIKIDSLSKNFPVEKFSDKLIKEWEQPDYYKESLHKLLKEHGY